ncbi:hypothetical protein QVD17_38916 [Tagetes erecta]|uniref:Wax synthase domain-containing protein n=1 Tax=Tagetes erecta TaxID=13708 RepID=A0AAD8JMM4_TARER|nr:hypothetical protein QVD17_38916 [Tagetes erecta]
MEDVKELKTFINIWFIAISSMCYCYFIPAKISYGVPRLLSLLPIIALFCILPLSISTVHLVFPTFFFLVWLANFKLLLFAFNRGPLGLSSKQNLPIVTFISIALFPINPKENYNKLSTDAFPFLKQILFVIKVAILTKIIVPIYQYYNLDNIHWSFMVILYFTHMYIAFELGFIFTALLVKFVHGFEFEIDPHFNEPYLATSVQDFWGHRWNLMTSCILRAMVYNPVRSICTPTLGKLRGQMLAIFCTFVVSGLMHELMYFYMIRVPPTWEVTWFFVLHGAWTACEVAVKKAFNGRFRLHRAVSWPLTLVFLIVTGWMFFEQPIKNSVDVKIKNETLFMAKYAFKIHL